jgi:NhaP-type Na+/H+ or K+/H+ antiporter
VLFAPLVSLAASGTVGGVTGAALATVLGLRRLPPRARAALVLAGATGAFYTAKAAHGEPLLACVVQGMYLANFAGGLWPAAGGRDGAASREAEELHATTGAIMGVTNVAFFGLLGASLKLPALVGSLWLAALVYAVRLAAIACGSWAGCTAGGASSETRRLFWLTMVTQAGIAMGLARMVATRFPEWGPNFQTLIFAIVLLNMLSGPPMFRAALMAAGEARVGGGSGGGTIAMSGLKKQQQQQQQHGDTELGSADSPASSPLREAAP